MRGFLRQGLWIYNSVRFSAFGNLLQTAEAFVESSEAGYSASELMEVLQVKTKHALTQLHRESRLQREKIESVFIYMSAEKAVAAKQRKARKALLKESTAAMIVTNPDLATEEAKALLLLFCSMLDERQRRLYAGLESLKLGHGGDAYIASLLGLDPHTVAKGRRELMSGDLTPRRKDQGQRRRTSFTGKKTPQIMDEIADIMKYETAGDPVSGCKWTRKTTAKIAKQLERVGIRFRPKPSAGFSRK